MSPARKPIPKGADGRPVAQNRRARHDYDIIDTYEAGMVLAGSEVKSLREGKAQLRDSYARVVDSEVWLYGMHIPPYAFASGFGATDPDRRRKLLLHRRQIEELGRRTTQDALTLVPLSVYFKDGPPAWNGGIGFWIPIAMFAVWLCLSVYVLARAVSSQFAEQDSGSAAPARMSPSPPT